MKRRHFIRTAGAAIASSSWLGSSVRAAEHGAFPPGPFSGISDDEIRHLFETSGPEVFALTRDVVGKCVLDKVLAPVPPFKNHWVYAGGPHYKGQWIWDTMFVVDVLSILPGKQALIREIFQNYWDFQDRWNARMPEYAHDMVTVAIKTEPQAVRQFSQIPILAWGVERVFQRNGDRELLKQCLPRLERFHDWYWRERDVTNVGLCSVGAYTGDVQHARWETFDYECNMDGLKLTKHPTRQAGGAWYGDTLVTANSSYLIMGEKNLVRLAKLMGDEAMAARRQARIDKAVKAMRQHMWDEEAGTFLSLKRDTLEKIPVATIGSWIPLAAGVPTSAMAKRMAEVLASDKWQTPLPLPTVDRSDERWRAAGFWRGDVWPSTNYQIARGLFDYGYKELAAEIADKTVANALRHGINEHYNSVTGKGIGVPDYTMSSSILTMMLDGITRKHRVRVKA